MGSYQELLTTMESLNRGLGVLVVEHEDLIHFRKALVMIAELGESRGASIARAALDAELSANGA